MSSARIEELRKKFDENPRRYFAPLANEYRKAGDFEQAIFICGEYLPQQPGHMSGHIVFGQALFEAKRLDEAKVVFETALSLDPENLIALRHLADISRDLGDASAARGWYERVLQADPRNEEIAAIMEKLGSDAAVAPTAEQPAIEVSPAPRPASDLSSAATVVLTAAAVQEMVRARQASKEEVAQAPVQPPADHAASTREVEALTLDTAPTVEINAASEAKPLDGLEPTSESAPLDMMPMEPLGLETNTAPGEQVSAAADAAHLDGLDTIPLEISLPDSSAVASTLDGAHSTPDSSPTAAPAGDGMLDLDSFSFGDAAEPVAEPVPVETAAPVDGAVAGGMDFGDLELPAAAPPPPPAEEPSVPTLIMDAVRSVVPAVQEAVQEAVESAAPAVLNAIESAAPAVMNLVDSVQSAVPSIVDAVSDGPTAVVEAISREVPAIRDRADSAAAKDTESRPHGTPFVTETMAQLYLGQGHRDEAIAIYRKLIESRPGDSGLRARLGAIEEEGKVAPLTGRAPETTAPDIRVRRFTGTGPSVRSVLREVFGIDDSVTAGAGGEAAGSPAEMGSIDMLFATESVADALMPLAVAFDGGFVAPRGNIDELFAGGG